MYELNIKKLGLISNVFDLDVVGLCFEFRLEPLLFWVYGTFCQFLQVMPGLYLKVGYDRFSPSLYSNSLSTVNQYFDAI
jgi:hypothetical protein